MSLNVKLLVQDELHEFKSMYFSGGEPHVELSLDTIFSLTHHNALIDARVASMHDFGILLALPAARNDAGRWLLAYKKSIS